MQKYINPSLTTTLLSSCTAPLPVLKVNQTCSAIKSRIQLFKVESNYYDKTLEERMEILGAPSINHLCKTIVFENTRWDVRDPPYHIIASFSF